MLGSLLTYTAVLMLESRTSSRAGSPAASGGEWAQRDGPARQPGHGRRAELTTDRQFEQIFNAESG